MKGRFYSTIDYNDMPQLACGLQARILEVDDEGLLQTVRRVLKILSAVPTASVILLESGSGRFHPDLIAAALIGFLPRRYRPYMIVMGAMWQKDKGIRGLIDTLVLKFADRAIQRYAVQSHEELTVFPEIWNIAPSKVRYCHYFYTLTDRELEDTAHPDGAYIFAGGNAHRDYEPLLEAAYRLPDQKFIIATRLRFPDVPPNVVLQSVPHEQFVKFMKEARVVITPIKPNLTRAAGQQTYLNAMRLGKVTVVNNKSVFGVREYIKDGENGVTVDGTAEGYIAALEWLLNPANRATVEAMQASARQSVESTFTYENHVACLTRIIDELLESEASAD